MDIFEKVNPSHPDKIADRIAGALVDLAYTKDDNPKVAVEVLIGHGTGYITGECSCNFIDNEIYSIVNRIASGIDQVIINIAVVTNFIPSTGIPLPFISYGGTSVSILLAEMGIVLSVSNQIKGY